MTLTFTFISVLFLIFIFIELKKRNIFVPLIANGMLFGEFSFYPGSAEEKLNFLIISLFILTQALTQRNNKIYKFFPRGFDGYLTVLLFLYLLIQSMRSIIVAPRGMGSLFWPFFFIYMALIFYIAKNRSGLIDPLDIKVIIRMSRKLLIILFSYLILIIFSYALFWNGFLDDSRYLPFRSTLLFTLTCFFPLVYIHYVHDELFWKRIALCTGFLGLLAAILVSSRAALVPILFLLSLTIFYNNKRSINLISTIILISTLVFSLTLLNQQFAEDIYQTLQDTIRIFSYQDKNLDEIEDLDRIIHYLTTWDILVNDFLKFFIGVGFRLSGLYLAQPLAYYYNTMLPHLDFNIELGNDFDVYSFGWNSMFLEYGLIGVFLIILCFVRNIIIIKNNSRGAFRIILLLTLIVFVLRLFANSFSGWVIFYLMIIPGFVFNFYILSNNSLVAESKLRK
jgi:hypothetical protein